MSHVRRPTVHADFRQWSVAIVGLALLIAAVWHYRSDTGAMLTTALETTTLVGLSLSVVAIGVSLGRAELEQSQLETVLRFCLLGGISGVLLSGWIVQVLGLRGLALSDVSFVALTMVAAGSSAGSFFGLNRDQLRRRTAALVDRANRLDEFTGIVSHDLRNPLNMAQGHLEQARETGRPEHFEAVEKAHDQMERLVRDIDTLAAITAEPVGAGDLEPMRPLPVADLASEVWDRVPTANARLRIEFDGYLVAEERRLRSLLRNLFRNAVEHGGHDVTVVVGGVDDGLYVEDDGVGIPMARREEVWRGGYTTTADQPGFGLAIVRRIAEAHGWRMRIEEGMAGGARFEFTNVERRSRPRAPAPGKLTSIYQL